MKTCGKNRHVWDERGFTIVELMIATIVFSFTMVTVAAVIVRFTNNFQRSIIESSTQNVARNIVDTIGESLQFGKDYGDSPNAYCIGTTKYEYVLGRQLGGPNSDTTTTSLIEKQGTGAECAAAATTWSVRQELLSKNMRLSLFDINEKTLPGGAIEYTVTVRVAYGDNDLLNNPTSTSPTCKPGQGFQFCAVRELSTTVQKRL